MLGSSREVPRSKKSGCSAAACKGYSIATLSRDVAQLQEQLGVVLFERRGEGLKLTESGAQLLEHAARVVAAKEGFVQAACGRGDELAGVVRISAATG